jgi:hypothetical protein
MFGGRISEMHTLRIILGGFLLLGVCLLLGRWIGGAAAVVGVAIKSFLVLWLIATLINTWVGVSKAGYSIKDEAPVWGHKMLTSAVWLNPAVSRPLFLVSESKSFHVPLASAAMWIASHSS